MAKPRNVFIRRRRQPPPAPPMPVPVRMVLLAIDSARTSGVATYVNGGLSHYDEINARSHFERHHVMADACVTTRLRDLPVVACIEAPWGGRLSAALSLTATLELWRDTWVRLGQDPARCLDRTAPEWRRMLFGRTRTREQARKLESLVAEQIAAKDLPGRPHRIGPDAAAAICIGQTQIRSRELHQLLARYSA